MKSCGVTIQVKPLQQYFHTVLFIQFVDLAFEAVDEILWCDHSNDSHGANCFSKFHKMKFGNLVEICFWLNLAVKGLTTPQIVTSPILPYFPSSQPEYQAFLEGQGRGDFRWGSGEGGEEKGRVRCFSPSALSLFRFHLSPFSPETLDTQATFIMYPSPSKISSSTKKSYFSGLSLGISSRLLHGPH